MAAGYYFDYFQHQSIALGFLIARLVTVFKINKRFRIIIMTIERVLYILLYTIIQIIFFIVVFQGLVYVLFHFDANLSWIFIFRNANLGLSNQ
jgi:hypothetical protein